MPNFDYAIVDVFSDVPLAGNPLAVVTDADGLTPEQMAAIATEFNLSETTFVTAPTLPGAQWRLRSFTPGGHEVGGAGHNSLGAWWWLATSGRAELPTTRQEIGGQVLLVALDTDGPLTVTLAQGPVDFTDVTTDTDALCRALNPTSPATLDPDRGLVVGSVGSPHLLVALPDIDSVDALRPDSRALRAVLADVGAEGCYLYTVATGDPDVDAYTRFVNPTVGIDEDPATGTAAGPLAAHLVGADTPRPVRIRQGVAMGRPSTVQIDVRADGTLMSGRCALAATGTLHL